MSTKNCFLCEVKPIFESTESFCEFKDRKICNMCIENLSTSVLPTSRKAIPIQVDIQEQATIEIGSWDKCEFHEHKLRLLCTTCNSHLCVLCVPLHNTHTFSSVEDLIVEMVPKLHELEYLLRFSLKESKDQNTEIEEILNKVLQFFSKIQGKSSNYIYSKCKSKITKFTKHLQDLVLNFKDKCLSQLVSHLKNPQKIKDRPKYLHWGQWNSHNLYVLDSSFQVHHEVLKDYKIPHFSRSIVVPEGIVVSGGRSEPDSKGLFTATLITVPGYLIKPLPDMNCGRANHCLLYYEGFVYVIGGCDHDNKYSNRVERLSTETKTWEVLAPTNRPRDSSSAIIHESEKSIYLFGGRFGGSLVTRSCEKYLIEANTWVTLNLELTFHSMVLGSIRFSEHEVLVFAGQNEVSQQIKKCNVVDLKTMTVREIQDFKDGGCIVNEPMFLDGKVACLVFKGSNIRGLHFWNPETEVWDGVEKNDEVGVVQV